MSAYSGRLDWDVGLVIQVAIVPGSAEVATPPDEVHLCPALVDTGASATCISRSVAEALGLQAISMTEMLTAGGAVATNVYSVHVGLVGATATSPDGTVSTDLQMLAGLQTPEFDPGSASYQVLLGRDVLRRGVLNMSFDGHFAFAV